MGRNEKGAVLVFVLFTISILSVMGVTLLATTVYNLRQKDAGQLLLAALYQADGTADEIGATVGDYVADVLHRGSAEAVRMISTELQQELDGFALDPEADYGWLTAVIPPPSSPDEPSPYCVIRAELVEQRLREEYRKQVLTIFKKENGKTLTGAQNLSHVLQDRCRNAKPMSGGRIESCEVRQGSANEVFALRVSFSAVGKGRNVKKRIGIVYEIDLPNSFGTVVTVESEGCARPSATLEIIPPDGVELEAMIRRTRWKEL